MSRANIDYRFYTRLYFSFLRARSCATLVARRLIISERLHEFTTSLRTERDIVLAIRDNKPHTSTDRYRRSYLSV